MAKQGGFDATGFYLALDAARQSRSLSWRQVADRAGVSASTLTRMAQGKRPDVDSLAALTSWSGLEVEKFLGGALRPEGEPLAKIVTYLRSDPNLTPEAADALDAVIKATYERLRTSE